MAPHTVTPLEVVMLTALLVVAFFLGYAFALDRAAARKLKAEDQARERDALKRSAQRAAQEGLRRCPFNV